MEKDTHYQPGDQVETVSGRVGTYVATRHDGRIVVQFDGERRSFLAYTLEPVSLSGGGDR